ncbi:MAG: preprotein translocase subunit SecE [Candidatus Brennerbacteria bacterium]|nr:preprotein translocase subunit SecE [Candidatus Brennerbacteria bacterium]
MFNKLTMFLQESRRELQRVNWPSREETIRYTAVVIGLSLVFAFYLGGLDFVFTYLIRTFLVN